MGIRGNLQAASFALRSRAAVVAFFLALSAASSGCINNLMGTASGLVDDSTTASDPSVGTGTDGNSSGLVLSRIQKNSQDPANTLDLLGDGSNAMGSFCTPKQNATQKGATTCTCAYTYIRTDGSQVGPIEVDTVYAEKDLIRCPYSGIPTDIPYFKVYIHLTNSDTRSNEVTFRFTGTGVSLDLANSASFTQAQRYQCRDIVFIPYLWDENIYDPILSEDPRYSYPFNFYTTNMGKTMALYAGSDRAAKGWNCPAIPNDTRAGMDLTVYSVSADSSGSKAIYPPGGVFDRSTFFLAKAKSGVFSVPVNAAIFPGANTGNGTTDIPPIGYAARPTAIPGGGESCPDTSVTTPQGFHWAKLWLFRASLPRRAYPVSPKLAQLGQISCNSRPWTPSTGVSAPNDTYFTDCSGQPNVESLDANGMAARFFEGTAMCAKVSPGETTDAATQAQKTSPIDFSAFAKGTDIFTPANRDPRYGCTGTSRLDPANICSGSAGGGRSPAFDSTLPLTLGEFKEDPRFDYLFVVSPTSVNYEDMNPSNSSEIHSVYTPVRFMSPNDCKSSDPARPSAPGDCSPSRMITYRLKTHEIGSPGNPDEDDANRPGDFPLCVLQPN